MSNKIFVILESLNLLTHFFGFAGLSKPNFEIIPKRKRSTLDQIIFSPMERLHKQLYDFAHEQSEVFFKEPVVGDFLIEQARNMMVTPPETALGAMFLGPASKELEITQSLSSTNVKTTNAYASFENGSENGEWLST